MQNDRSGLLFESERRKRRKTAEEANHCIEELEVQVAIREMELELCIRSPNTDKSPFMCEAAFGRGARDRSMVMEIRGILVKLEGASSQRLHRVDLTAVLGHFKSFRTLQEPRYTDPVRLHHRTSNLPPSLPSQNDEELQHHPFTTEPLDSPSAMLDVVQSENHIREIFARVEAARTERRALIAAAARQRRATSGMKKDNIEDILRIEEECVRLSAQVCHLQWQMDKAKTETKSRESELLKEIEVLRSWARRTSSPLVPVDASIAEESMGLATPLQPSLLLSTRSHDTPPEPIDHLSLRTSCPDFSARVGSSHGPTSLDIQRVLTIARENIAQKENALSQLRTEVEDLRRQIPHPSPPQGRGGILRGSSGVGDGGREEMGVLVYDDTVTFFVVEFKHKTLRLIGDS
ncbi:hypothetical protein EDC04DRAFT_2912560 [Pisolithus marmoratus]|nr:hypothetical protein EDC04DRAFT_2912560 [Pisolithus marmoratus]